jgi:hypothetical protein
MPKVEELMVGLWAGGGIRDGLGFRDGTSFACDQPRKRWQMRHTGGGAAREPSTQRLYSHLYNCNPLKHE